MFNCYMHIILVLVVHKKLNDNSALAHTQNGSEVEASEDGLSLEILHFQQMLSFSLLSMNALKRKLLFYGLFQGNQ